MITGTTLTPRLGSTYNAATKRSEAEPLNIERRFLYIGNSAERASHCFSIYDSGSISFNYREAMSALVDLNENGAIPDFIIVDLPFDEKGTFHFVLWLHSHKWSYMIPLLYNESVMSAQEIVQLKELNIADDIINIAQSS